MRKILFCIIVALSLMGTCIYGAEVSEGNGNIGSMTLEEYIMMMQARQGKVDIIKKNNLEIENLKKELRTKILEAAEKVNNLKIDISNEKVILTDETLNELKMLLQFLQDSKSTLELDAAKISKEINDILDLISIRGLELAQYDKIIDKQNELIVKMKQILATVNKI